MRVDDPERPDEGEGDLEDRKFYRAEQEAGFADAAPTDELHASEPHRAHHAD